MEFLPLLIVLVFLSPILAPLFMWFVLKKRDSKVYKIARYARFVLAFLVLAVAAMNLMKAQNPFEGLGGLAANVLIAYLLSKKWLKEVVEQSEGTQEI